MSAVTVFVKHRITGEVREMGMSFDILETVMSCIIALVCATIANAFCSINYFRKRKSAVRASKETSRATVENAPKVMDVGKGFREEQYTRYMSFRKSSVISNDNVLLEYPPTPVSGMEKPLMEKTEKTEKTEKPKESRIRELVKELTIDSRRPKVWQILLGGIFIALGACGMHYRKFYKFGGNLLTNIVGMEAMVIQADKVWNPWLVTLSVIIALVAGSAGLFLCFYASGAWVQVVSSFIICAAVCAMHVSCSF
jgi:NO-binding membrane sensor protein with MHYT domain